MRKFNKTRSDRRAKHRMPAPPPAPITWEGVAAEFRDMNLHRLLTLSALLSADDALGGQPWSDINTFAHLHPALLQNFTRAVLASDARYDSIATPSTGDFLYVLINGVGELQNHPLTTSIPRMDLVTLNTDVFSPMWRQQSRLDGRSVVMSDLGRAHATLVHFPDVLQGDIARKQRSGYVHLDTHFKATHGCSIDTVLRGTMLIYMRYQRIFNSQPAFNPTWLQDMREGGPNMAVDAPNLKRYVEGALPDLNELYIGHAELSAYLAQYLPADEVPQFLHLISASIDTLRDLLRQSPYSSGIAAFAPLPLELKPLVRVTDGRYLIPNLRSLLMGMARLPLTLLARDPNPNVMSSYGLGLEGYVVAATTERAAGTAMAVIPEFIYKHPDTGAAMESADATLLEPGQRRTLVEVKARRLPDYGQALPGTTAFKALDDLITRTVLVGLDKARHLDTRLRSEHAAALAGTSIDSALIAVVYGETVGNFDGVFRSRIAEGHPLHAHLGHFVALSIAEYEHHLDLAKERGVSVIELLQKSAEEFSNREELQLTSHIHLGNVWPQEQYVDRYLDDLVRPLSLVTSGAKAL